MSARDSDPTSDAGYTTAGVPQTGPIKIEKLSYLREESIYDLLDRTTSLRLYGVDGSETLYEIATSSQDVCPSRLRNALDFTIRVRQRVCAPLVANGAERQMVNL